MAHNELEHLLRVLNDRDIGLTHDDLAWAFESGTTKDGLQAWVQEYLTPPNLLTKEELNFHEKHLAPSGGGNGAVAGRPLPDADFEAAINSLEASTAAIEKQCQILEVQKQALKELGFRHSADDSIGTMKASKQTKLARDKAQLDFHLAGLTDSLSSDLQSSLKQTDAAVSNLPSSMERVLEKDDRLLDGLQKVLTKLEPHSQPHTDLENEVEKLCEALTTLTAREIRLQVDAAYTTLSYQDEAQLNGHSTDDKKAEKQRQSLRAELDELCNEIDGLASMAVDHQFRSPISRKLKTAKGDSELEKAQWSEYVADTLHFATTRLEALGEHSKHIRAHQSALRSISTSLESVLATPSGVRQNVQVAAKSPATPIAKGLKPLRLVQAHSEQDPAIQLLRYLDIRVADPTNDSKLTSILEQAVLERRTRLSDLASNTGRWISDALADSLAKADGTVEELLGAVYAHSKLGTIELADRSVQKALDGLEEKTQRLGEDMRAFDVQDVGKVIKEKQKQILRA